ncbi:hypothetical protein CNYM01_13986 [Colletotrichum nymphaeae SA-01]|uniref:Uncharacterized protein n=1 Tax=Colletotrichum nymphaeae SA-01 TaxID=1460502 RepID=A0A135UX92_9PEZI|nr:hypothetical protein CNYM01_13986 [Colletotrichum nymphaeae SA-01]
MAPPGVPGDSSRKRSASPLPSDENDRYELRSKAKKAKVGKKLGFLSLPAELRNMVYDLTLVQRRIIISWDRCKMRFRHHRDHRVSGSLLRTCKAVYADARALMYSATFELENMEYLEEWLRTLGSGAVDIRDIRLTRSFQASYAQSYGVNLPVWYQGDYRATTRQVAKLLSGCHHLENLELGFLYTTKYQTTPLIENTDNPPYWKKEARLLAEMVFRDLFVLLVAAKASGKTVDQVASLAQIHHKNFECLKHHPSNVGKGNPHGETRCHMKLLVAKYIANRSHPRKPYIPAFLA